jgi:radical SAM protein with 4Fe4S-binding SPASM domain
MVRSGFLLDEIVAVPEQVIKKSFVEGDLHITKNNPSWILTSALESSILGQLRNKKTIREAAKIAHNQYPVTIAEVESSTRSLLTKINEFGFYEGATIPDDNKLAMHLYLTNACNLKCRHCYKDAGVKKENELTLDEIKRIVDVFSSQGESQIVLSGGEVLLRKDFFDIANYIKFKGHKVNVVTNGTMITNREIAEKLVASVDFLQISLDGASKETNDFYRGKGTFEKILNAVNLFVGIDFVINIGMVVSEINYEDIKNNLADLVHSKIKHDKIKLNISGLMGYGRGQNCNPHDGNDYVQKIFEIATSINIAQKPWRLPNTKAFDCGYARSITIDSNGDIYYCPVANQDLDTGMNIRETPFHEIMLHFKDINKSISVESIPGCCDCELEYLCAGGCRLENKLKRGDLLIPECNIEKKDIIYKELIKSRI